MNISLFPADNDAFFTLDSGTRRYRIGADVDLRGTQGKISPLQLAFSVQIFSREKCRELRTMTLFQAQVNTLSKESERSSHRNPLLHVTYT